MEISIRDLITLLGVVAAVCGSHFMLRAKIMVLEERTGAFNRQVERIIKALDRIEEKLDQKADK